MVGLSNKSNEFNDHKIAFKEAWSDLLSVISNDPYFEPFPKASVDWMLSVLKKTVPFGKHGRAGAAISFYLHLKPNPTLKELRLTYSKGWFMEIFQSAALIADDIMDESEMRRGQECWYKRSEVGLGTAINDAFMLENLVYYLLWKYRENEDIYLSCLRLTQDVALKTILGQGLDSRLCKDVEHFSMENYSKIVKYKTSYYTFYAPLADGLIRAGIKDKEVFDGVEKFAVKLGHLFQAQDDFLDCFGKPHITGKIGTDIMDGKSTWLLATALEIGNEDQRKTLLSCIGSKDPSDEDMVRAIYADLEIADRFKRFEYEIYMEIIANIKDAHPTIPKKPLFAMLNRIYQRER